MIVSTGPLADLVPLVPAAMEGRQLCQWDKDSCADAGFLKIDLLGLGMLSAVEECVDLIARARGETLDLSRAPLDDPGTYAEIQAADTVGVFQIESRAQMQMLLRTRPENLEDLTVEVALVRPGPIQGGAVHPYLQRREAVSSDPDYQVPHDHPLLAEALADTLGVIVYQDQVLDVAVALAGFSQGQAESLRRAMSRRRSREAMVAHWHAFRDGARRPRRRRADRAARVREDRGVLGVRLPQGARRGLRPAGLPERLAAPPLPRRVPLRAAQRAADGLLPARLARPRRAAPRRRGARRRRQRLAGVCSIEPDGAVRIGLGYVAGSASPRRTALVEARDGDGPYGDVADLARRTGLSRPSASGSSPPAPAMPSARGASSSGAPG